MNKEHGLIALAIEYGILKKDGRKIVLPNGEKHFPADFDTNKNLYTKELLDYLDIEFQKHFKYGQEEELILKENEEEEQAVAAACDKILNKDGEEQLD